jgi:PHP family Zn ribbon phosphoesterase
MNQLENKITKLDQDIEHEKQDRIKTEQENLTDIQNQLNSFIYIKHV